MGAFAFFMAFGFGVLALLRGRRWQALAGISISTYLHGTPGIYAWPWMFLEDAIAAWRRPDCRRGFWLRAAATVAGKAARSIRRERIRPFLPDGGGCGNSAAVTD